MSLTIIPSAAEQPKDDYALMRDIGAGDVWALRAMYDRHSSIVYTLAARMLKDPQEAEQLLTDVFFEIWNARARYDESRASPLTYLMRLTRSRAIDRLRRKGPVTGISLDSGEGIDIAVNAPPDGPSEAAEERARVMKALSALDEEQRRAIECAYYEGLSHSQIADRLNKPLGSVKSCIRIGLVKLRDLLKREN